MTYWKQGLASGLAAVFAAGAIMPGNGNAQYTRGGGTHVPHTQQVSGDSWMPRPDSESSYLREQYDMLKPHEEFIRRMRNCCTLRDGRANLEEIINDGSDERFPLNPRYPTEEFPYIVLVTHDLNGKQLDEPTVVYVPRDKIISKREALETCKSDRLLKGRASTCVPMDKNVLWAYDNSDETGYRNGTDKHRIRTFFCYYPWEPGS